MKYINYILLLFLGLLTTDTFAQLLTNNGAIFYSQPNAIIAVQGSVKNIGTINHNGFIQIDSSYVNHSYSSGNGVFDLYGNWQNSGSFICDTSHVFLKGSQQYISGDSATHFYKLSCMGNQKKIMQQNVHINKQLNLNSLELATMQDTLFIDNISPYTIENNSTPGQEGFVSSSDNGTLIRKMQGTILYTYPLGSSNNIPRYRPLNIEPYDNNPVSYAASLVNYTPESNTNIDTSLCDINQLFYHKVHRVSGTSAAYIQAPSYIQQDGYFNLFAYLQDSSWTAIHNSTYANNYNAVVIPVWDTSMRKIVLANKGAVLNGINGSPVKCLNDTGFYFIQNIPGYTPYWNISGGTILDSTAMSAVWNNPGNNLISVYLRNPLNNCISNTVTFPVYTASLPDADFYYQQSTQMNNNYINFYDQTSGEPVSWNWNFGNGNISDQQNTNTVYTHDGSYTVLLTVKNQYGCQDTAMKIIDIKEAIFIPSAFTPDGDGVNDQFEILYNGNFIYSIKIVNRWGQEIWNGDQTQMWDGKTKDGNECSQGTYYYFLNGSMNGLGKEYKGSVT